MAVEPEEVLEEDGIAAEGGVENADAEYALERDEGEGDGQDGRGQDEDDAGGVDATRGRAGGGTRSGPGQRMLVDGDDEIEAGEDGAEAGDEDAGDGEDDVGVGEGGAVRECRRSSRYRHRRG